MDNKMLMAARLKMATIFVDQSYLNGFQVMDSNGWEFSTDPAEPFKKVLFVEDDEDSSKPSVKKVLLVTFKPNSAIVKHASLNGAMVDGSEGFGQELMEQVFLEYISQQ